MPFTILKNFFSRKSAIDNKAVFSTNEQKSQPNIYNIDLTNTSQISRILYGSDCSYSVTDRQAYKYYAKVAALRASVDKISEAVSELPLVVSTTNDDMTIDHEIIHGINNPGIGVDKSNLLKELTVSCLLTNESWLLFRGRINAVPVNIDYVRPYNVNVDGIIDDDGLPPRLRTDSPKDKRIYYKYIINGQVRYLDNPTSDNLALNEIIPIIGIVDLEDQFRGLSPLTSIKKDLDNLWYGNVHNSSLLKNGMRVSAILSPKSDITEPQFKQLNESLSDLQGATNAGGVFVAPTQLESTDMMLKNTDADYTKLIDKAEQRVYAAYEIPLPLVMPNVMTLSNYEAAQVAFYDQTVTDATTKLFPAIAKAFSNRTGETDIKLTFNPHEVKALQQRQAERMETLRKTYALGTKEIRKTAGYGDPMPDDPILAPGNLVAIATDSTPTFDIDDDEGEDG